MEDIKLIDPSSEIKESYLEYLNEISANQGIHKMFPKEEVENDFDGFVQKLMDCRDKEEVFKINMNWVAFSIYWLIKEKEYLGRISFRHELTGELATIGGHIGYDIREKYRGKGYGTLILKLGLEVFKNYPEKKFLITCDKDNIASKKIIERNGGEFENEIPNITSENAVPKLRFWIQNKN